MSEAFDGLRAAFASVQDDATGVLTISAMAAFAANWLAPRIGSFQLRHPALAVRMSTSNHLVDFAREEVDIGLRSGRGDWPGLVAHRPVPAAVHAGLQPGTAAAARPGLAMPRTCCACRC